MDHVAQALPDAAMPYELARATRNACMSISWHAANTKAGYAKDAARDLREFKHHLAQIQRFELVPANASNHMEKMFRSMAWRAANLRKQGVAFKNDADKDGNDFDAAKEAFKNDLQAPPGQGATSRSDATNVVVLGIGVVEVLSALASAAAWFAANSRARYAKDAKRDLSQLVRAFNSLFVRPRQKWFGVNLGGCTWHQQ